MELQWPLILFTTFMAWSAGTFGAQAVYALRGRAPKAQMPALIVTLVTLVVGGVAVFMHLQHWERIFNGFGHITSGITQELIAIVVMFVLMVLYFAYLRRGGAEAKVPAWLAVLAIISALALCVVMSHSYMMPSRPAWDSVFQVLSIVGAACAFGVGTMGAIIAFVGGEDADAQVDGVLGAAGTGVNALLTIVYLVALAGVGGQFVQIDYYFDPTGPTRGINDIASLSPFAGEPLMWSVVAIVCALVALCAALVAWKKGSWKLWGIVIVVAVFVAAIALRVDFYLLGASVYPFTDLTALVG